VAHVLLACDDASQPPEVLAELMGHEEIAVTNRYMHLTPGANEQVIQALEVGAENGARMAAAGAPGKPQ
jgi:hypothetical protein